MENNTGQQLLQAWLYFSIIEQVNNESKFKVKHRNSSSIDSFNVKHRNSSSIEWFNVKHQNSSSIEWCILFWLMHNRYRYLPPPPPVCDAVCRPTSLLLLCLPTLSDTASSPSQPAEPSFQCASGFS